MIYFALLQILIIVWLIDLGEKWWSGSGSKDKERKHSYELHEEGDVLFELNGTKMKMVNSSAVSAAGYNDRTSTLYIKFTSGAVYEYQAVPYDEYLDFISSDSPGRYVQDVLTLKYKYNAI